MGFDFQNKNSLFISFIGPNSISTANLGADIFCDLYTVLDTQKLVLVSQLQNICFVVEDQGTTALPVVSSFDLGSQDICCQVGSYHHLKG